MLSNALRYGGGHPVEVRLERTSEGARAGGLGLGLFIVRQIVEGHRGRVHVEPGPGGKGTAFVVELSL